MAGSNVGGGLRDPLRHVGENDSGGDDLRVILPPLPSPPFIENWCIPGTMINALCV